MLIWAVQTYPTALLDPCLHVFLVGVVLIVYNFSPFHLVKKDGLSLDLKVSIG